MAERATRHLVLLGLPGSGKSTVGPLVADALGRPFVDLDAEIEAREGMPVSRIFAERGEPYFRALEEQLTAEFTAPGEPRLVMAPGGGWAESAVNRALFGQSVSAVYLRVSPPVAMERLGDAVQARPLLAGPDPARKLTELLARREPLYLQANHTVSVDSLTPAAVASSIVALASNDGRD